MTTMKNPCFKVGYNIRCLREGFGESGEDLCFALGISKGTLSDYETGARGKVPNREMLIKIARHYRITVDRLINGDFTGFQAVIKMAPDFRKLQELKETILPILCSDVALTNQRFVSAYNIHMQLWEGLKRGVHYDEDLICRCMEIYEQAAKEGILDAHANLLWWYMHIGEVLSEAHLLDGYQELFDRKTTYADFVKYSFLPNFDEELNNLPPQDQQKAKKQYVIAVDDEVYGHIKALKESPTHHEIGDYYLAYRYVVGMVDNERSLEENNVVGQELLSAFLLLGNSYATRTMVELNKLANPQ